MATYTVNEQALSKARSLIKSRQYVIDSSWGSTSPSTNQENDFLERNGWERYAEWHLGLAKGATSETKSRYAFGYGDFRRVHRMGLIACRYRAAEWNHKEIEIVAHELLQYLDKIRSG
jgi:hypothetical protein